MSAHPMEQELLSMGIQPDDIKLTQKLTRRALENHLNLTHFIRTCERCALSMECYGQNPETPIVTTDRVIGTGPWNSPLMIVGDMPGEYEAKFHTPFVGLEGQLLSLILAKAGVDRNAVYMTYAVKCAATREPTMQELKSCRYHMEKEIEAISPHVILTIGEQAMKVVRDQYNLVLEQEHGKLASITVADRTIKVIHTYSPLSMNKVPGRKASIWNAVKLAVQTVRTERNHYSYDRVGLQNI